VLENESWRSSGYGVQGPGRPSTCAIRHPHHRGSTPGGNSWERALARQGLFREKPFLRRKKRPSGDRHPVPCSRMPVRSPCGRRSRPASSRATPFIFRTVSASFTRIRPASSRRRTWMWCWWPRRGPDARCAPISWTAAGINASFAVYQDYTGQAREKTLALGIRHRLRLSLPTTFEREVVSDLTGERGILMGALAGVMEAQYNLLRRHGHSPSEAFNETVEELTQSLIVLVAEKAWTGCSPTAPPPAQRGALDWAPRFRDAVAPVIRPALSAGQNR